MDGLGYACAVSLAAVFIRAGAAKLARPLPTGAGFAALGVPAPEAMARAVPLVELLSAVFLLVVPRVGAVAALLLLFGFSIFVGRAVRSGVIAPCNCFGAARSDPVSMADLVRNGLLGALAVAAATAGVPERPDLPAVVTVAAAFAAGLIVMAAVRRLLAS